MYLCLRFEHAQPAGSRGMAVGRSCRVHSANNKELSTFEPRSGGKTIKHRLLVIKYTRNCHADCLYLPILHHLHPIEQSTVGLMAKLGMRGHVLGCKIFEEEPWGPGHQENLGPFQEMQPTLGRACLLGWNERTILPLYRHVSYLRSFWELHLSPQQGRKTCTRPFSDWPPLTACVISRLH
jgi:hypothetical protein